MADNSSNMATQENQENEKKMLMPGMPQNPMQSMKNAVNGGIDAAKNAYNTAGNVVMEFKPDTIQNKLEVIKNIQLTNKYKIKICAKGTTIFKMYGVEENINEDRKKMGHLFTKISQANLLKATAEDQGCVAKCCVRPWPFHWTNYEEKPFHEGKQLFEKKMPVTSTISGTGCCYKLCSILSCGFLADKCCKCCSSWESKLEIDGQISTKSDVPCNMCRSCKFSVVDQQGRFRMNHCVCNKSCMLSRCFFCCQCLPPCANQTYTINNEGMVHHDEKSIKVNRRREVACGCFPQKTKWWIPFPAKATPQEKIEYINAVMLLEKNL